MRKLKWISMVAATMLVLSGCGGTANPPAPAAEGQQGTPAAEAKTLKWKFGHLANENHV